MVLKNLQIIKHTELKFVCIQYIKGKLISSSFTSQVERDMVLKDGNG